MPAAPDFSYDVFLSHASEDTAWCRRLAERLRNEDVRVWLDSWELKGGDNLIARINEALQHSRKMVVVMSASYFRDSNAWTLAEAFIHHHHHSGGLEVERPLIPLLIEDCTIPPLLSGLIYLDFRNPDDFELRLHQLIESLDLPRHESLDLPRHGFNVSPLNDAYDRIINFARRFGEPHITLAMHAALPLGLTAELVHLIRANFIQSAPMIAEADLLLSPLCREVGGEFYEMYPEVRELLLAELNEDEAFGAERVKELADFLMVYATRHLKAARHPEQRDFLAAQLWTALAHRDPAEAARSLAEALQRRLTTSTPNPVGSLRLAQLARTMNAQLMGQDHVLSYAAGIEHLARGDVSRAAELFDNLGPLQQAPIIKSITLPAPVGLTQWWPEVETTAQPEAINQTQARIFICYKHKVEPDQTVVDQIVQALESQHTIFIDKKILPSLEWGKWIKDRISESDFLIAFLTAQSVRSEMVRAEIEMAHTLAREQDGRPQIIPVRLAYYEEFNYPLSVYLNHVQWAEWASDADTPRLIEQLQQVIAGKSEVFQPTSPGVTQPPISQSNEPPASTAAAPRRPLNLAKLPAAIGTLELQSPLYIVRASDETAANAIQRQGATITIKGPRQMGKSSLLIRILEAAVKAGKRPVFLDYQLIERATLTDADSFYRHFCNWVTEELDLENRVDEYWNSSLGNSQRCTRYFSRYLLKELNQTLVLAMDEVENLFDTSFRSDFFSMLRSWHNSRANIATPIWKQLDLVLSTSTEPYLFIESVTQSPFNVGEVINLEDFTLTQVATLNQRRGSPLSTSEERALMQLLGGHPYLTQQALFLISTGRSTIADLFTKATDDRGPFSDHLRYFLLRLHDKEDLLGSLRQVLQHNTCSEEAYFRLHGAGLVRREGGQVVMRNQLYADFFREHLISS
jgi:hypothetical protein